MTSAVASATATDDPSVPAPDPRAGRRVRRGWIAAGLVGLAAAQPDQPVRIPGSIASTFLPRRGG